MIKRILVCVLFAFLLLVTCAAVNAEEGYVPVPRFVGCTGRTCTVSLEYPDLQDTYPVDFTQYSALEYSWGFKFTDGTHHYEVMTCHFCLNPDPGVTRTKAVDQMQTNLWGISDSGGSVVGRAELVIIDTSLVWTFDVPEDADLSQLWIYETTVLLPEEYYFSDTQVSISSVEPTADPTSTPEPARTPGDVNGDGTLDGRDLLRLARLIAGNNVTIDAAAADMNGDGQVDGRDILRLAKQLAGM